LDGSTLQLELDPGIRSGIVELEPAVAPQEPQTAFDLPDIGGTAGLVMTPAEERRLGQAFMRSVRSSVKVVDDPLLTEYIEDLGERLVELSGEHNKHFTFFLVEDPVINAFAGPGGYIGIHTGLIIETQSESELASVMAHEIAHVTQNHLFRAFDEFSRLSGPAALATLGAILLGTVSGPAAAAAVAGIQAGMVQAQLNFTRANENEADREGIRILADAGYDPRAMPVFFERMGRATWVYDTKIPEFLMTHPVTTNRIADSLGRAESYSFRQPAVDPRYFLSRSRIRLETMKDPNEAVRHFRQTLKDGRFVNESAERYGYALALLKARKFSAARTEIDKLLKQEPTSPAFLIASAQIDKDSGKSADGLLTMRTAYELFPSSFPISVAFADLLLDSGDAREASEVLQKLQKRRPTDPGVYERLARAADAEGKRALAHGYMAEHYYYDGLLEAAVRQLEIAVRDRHTDYYESAKLAARLNELQTELLSRKREDRGEGKGDRR